MSRVTTTVLAIVLSALAARGAETVKPDLTSPKAAAKSLFLALGRGDSAGARAAAIADEKQGQMLDAMAVMMGGMTKLRDAAVAKFGDEAKKLDEGIPAGAMADKCEKAEEKIDGDKAVLTIKDDKPITLKKTADGWKVDMSAIQMEGATPEDIIKQGNSIGKAAADTADEIKADKYKTLEDAMQAMQKKMAGQ